MKGGLALDFRLRERARTTKDLDLGRQDNRIAATEDFLAMQEVDLGDYFRFSVQQTSDLDALVEWDAVRYRVTAELAGRRFETVIIDVGFGDPIVAPPDLVRGLEILSFAGFEPLDIPTVPLEQHVAEKVHAYTRIYAGDRTSTRVKDLVDIVLIQANGTLDAALLHRAFQATFDTRGIQAIPTTLPLPPSSWTPEYSRLAMSVGLDPDLSAGHAAAAAFLDPVLGASLKDGVQWNPELGK